MSKFLRRLSTDPTVARPAYLVASVVLLTIAACGFLPLTVPVKVALLAPALLAAETLRRTADVAWGDTE